MRRRAALAAAGATLVARGAAPQQRLRRVGYLRWDTPRETAPGTLLQQRLAELGWVQGRNLALEFGWAEGDGAKARELAATMQRNGAEIIVASSTPAVEAAIVATQRIPIVMAPAADPIASGFVASLARPGGYVTGVTIGGSELSAKRLELLREALPVLRRVAFLGNARDPAARLFAEETRIAADRLALELRVELIDGPDDIEAAIGEIARRGAQALIVQPIFTFHRDRVAAAALKHRLPTVSELRPMAEAGVMMIYGTPTIWATAAAAEFVDRILRGAKPSDLPVERPTRVELVINLRTARALGLDLPQVLLQRAEEVIE